MENEKTETMKNESESIEHIKEENTIEKNDWFKEPMKIKPIFSEEKPDNKIENADRYNSGLCQRQHNFPKYFHRRAAVDCRCFFIRAGKIGKKSQ